jgi:hypothetical protein
MRSTRLALAACVAATALLAMATPALAIVPVVAPTPSGTTVNISNAVGSQTDPHVSGSRVSYSNEASSPEGIRYFDFATGATTTVPTADGDGDVLSELFGSTIVFTRFTATGSSITSHDVSTGAQATLAPGGSPIRTGAAIGGRTVAWEDYTGPFAPSEVGVYDLDTGTSSLLTNDPGYDLDPAVSEDGSAIVWVRCTHSASGCDIYSARRNSSGSWSVSPVSATANEEQDPATNGSLAVYSDGGPFLTGQDIRWRALGGGDEQRLELPGPVESRPTISGDLIAFESTAEGDTDVGLYDVVTNRLYWVAAGETNEQLSDVSLDAATGRVRVVYTAPAGANGQDIFAFTFTLDTDGDGVADPLDNCRVDANADQADLDGDGLGDACDADTDGDGVPNGQDGFPRDPAESLDSDGDGVGDNGDNCPMTANPSQADGDGDGIGDACDVAVPTGACLSLGAGAFGSEPKKAFALGVLRSRSGFVLGGLVYLDRARNVKLRSRSITAVTCTNTEARIQGTATVNGAGSYTFTATAADVSRSGVGDTFALTVSNGYSATGALAAGRGNVVVIAR